jgi:hypothetical protein
MNTKCVAAVVFLCGAPTTVATELQESGVEVSFRLPDGAIRSIILSQEKALSVAGPNGEYHVDWWIRAARTKLSIPSVIACTTGGPELRSVVTVSEGSDALDDTWSLLQPRHDLPQVSVAYELKSCQ